MHDSRMTSPAALDPVSARRGRIVLGTFAVDDNEAAPALLDRYYAAGGRALDLADVYRDGEAAQAAGTWLRKRGLAGDVVLWAKGCRPLRPTRTWCSRRWSTRSA